jgi:hypothetical protein
MTDIVERLRRFSEPVGGGSVSPKDLAKEAADEIERLRKVNVMQARWLHEAHEDHKLLKDKIRQLLSFENAALKEGE